MPPHPTGGRRPSGTWSDSTTKAFIPASNEALRGLAWVNRDLLAFAGAQGVDKTATLDTDATLVETTEFKKAVAEVAEVAEEDWQPMLRTVKGRSVETGVQ